MDEVIRETCIQFGSIRAPGQAQSSGSLTSLGVLLFSGEGQISAWLVFIGHQIPDLNSVVGGDTDPLEFGVEKDLVDLSLSIN
jgi:hypothetical protein